ncbi:MAG TPA: hypothetical protein VGI95_03540 [Caulobacteraceae bacterium]|jgi:heme exporter protein D
MSKWLYTLECPDGRFFAKIVNATLEGDAEVLGNDLWRGVVEAELRLEHLQLPGHAGAGLFPVVVAAVALARLGGVFGLVASVGGQRGALFHRRCDASLVVASNVTLVAIWGDFFAFAHHGLLVTLSFPTESRTPVIVPELHPLASRRRLDRTFRR